MIDFVGFGLNLLVGIVALALYLAMRSQAEYLAIAIALLASSLQAAGYIWDHLHAYTATSDFLEWLAIGLTAVASLEFVRLFVHRRRWRWLLALQIALILAYLRHTPALSGPNHGSCRFLRPFWYTSDPCCAVTRAADKGSIARQPRCAPVYSPFAIIGFLNYWLSLRDFSFFWHLPVNLPPMPTFHVASYG